MEYLEVRFRSFKGLGYKHKSDSDRQRYRSLTGNSPADHGPPADPGIKLDCDAERFGIDKKDLSGCDREVLGPEVLDIQ